MVRYIYTLVLSSKDEELNDVYTNMPKGEVRVSIIPQLSIKQFKL